MSFAISHARGTGSTPVVTATLQDLVARARTLIGMGDRRVLGITGAPGAGKSTLCTALLTSLGDDAALVGMDGFHLADQELARLSRRDRKGAPDTFDVGGYAALLRRLCSRQEEGTIYAPLFDRQLEEPIGSAVPIDAETRLVITEGNYLLFEDGGWESVRECLDEVWFLEVPPELRRHRLFRRRQSFGEAAADATAWVDGVDEPNAAMVAPTRARADLVIHLITRLGDFHPASEPVPTRAPTAEPDATTKLGKEN